MISATGIVLGCFRTHDRDDTVVVVFSEFGRTVHENGNSGTDHGHGNVIWVLGGGVGGGRGNCRLFDPGCEKSRERLTVCWREPDSNLLSVADRYRRRSDTLGLHRREGG
jgi:Protein of unknown function (DUF1501)